MTRRMRMPPSFDSSAGRDWRDGMAPNRGLWVARRCARRRFEVRPSHAFILKPAFQFETPADQFTAVAALESLDCT